MGGARLTNDPLLAAMKRYWGYDSFRPLQREAMQAIRRPRLGRRAADRRRQVPLLPGAGAGAAGTRAGRLAADLADERPGRRPAGERRAGRRFNSTMASDEHASVRRCARGVTGCSTSRRNGWRPRAASFLGSARATARLHRRRRSALHQPVGARLPPRYRQLARLREAFPGVGLHAYTATATGRVRRDIAAQLHCASRSSWSARSTGRTSSTASCRAPS